MKSVNGTLDQYRPLIAAQGRGGVKLPNENFDTGEPLKPGKYKLADAAYAKLLDKLSGKPVPADCATTFWRSIRTSTLRLRRSETKRPGGKCSASWMR